MSKFYRFSFTLLFSMVIGSLLGQRTDFNDGPYISYHADSLEIFWVEKGQPQMLMLHKDEEFVFDRPQLPKVDIGGLKVLEEDQKEYNGVKKFLTISDVHGQFGLLRKFLTSHGVIDSNQNWVYGDGHLIIVGDILDRGDEVLECLWLIYRLEQQARENGGRVHYLLGNHEVMVINDDLRYIHKKYNYTSGAARKKYSEFFGPETFFGKWLSTKNVMLSLNDITFVHGGISPSLVRLNLSEAEINRMFQEEILWKSVEEIKKDTILDFLVANKGPIWYRNLADPSKMTRKKVKNILDGLGRKAIVIGHTSQKQVRSLYGNKVFLVDSSIKFGKTGEVLVWKDDQFFRGDPFGKLVDLVTEFEDEPLSLFETIFNDPHPVVTIQASIKEIYNAEEEIYTEGQIKVETKNGSNTLDGGIRMSGFTRKKVCNNPPLKLNFKKKQLREFGYSESDKFKIVRPCKNGNIYENYLKKEHLIYELYRIVEPLGLRSKLVEIVLDDEKKEPKSFIGMAIEHKEHFCERNGVKLIENAVVRPQSVEKQEYLKFCLFQWMIANPDFYLMTRHNLFVMSRPDKYTVSLVPFDFDSAGLINAHYVGPPSAIPISALTERYFMEKDCTMDEIRPVIAEMLLKKQAILDHCQNADYLDEKTKSSVIRFLSKSFEILENEKRARKMLGVKK